jgi:hypothetical protein
MKQVFGVVMAMLIATIAVAETKPILLVTPKGVFETQVVDGVPGVWKPSNADVIVQGFTNGVPPVVKPPVDDTPSDPVVSEVASISKSSLKDKTDAIALASLIDALQKSNLSQKDFNEAFEMSIPIVDSSLNAGGRLVLWRAKVAKVTTDPAKLKAGLQSAFNISAATLGQVSEYAFDKNAEIPESAIELSKIIQIIQMIMDLLKTLGLI